MSDLTVTSRRYAAQPSLLSRLLHAAAVARSRRALSRLDDEALADIGLSVTEAREEADLRVAGGLFTLRRSAQLKCLKSSLSLPISSPEGRGRYEAPFQGTLLEA